MSGIPTDRIEALDLVRGVAVLGILAVNIQTFAGPAIGSLTPNYPVPGSAADQWAFSATLLLFEGKMRGLFSLLFGASMILFIDRAEARGRDGAALQARRLGWLALLGYLHFALLWPGDILFTYALAGLAMLAFHRAPISGLAGGALAFFLLWHLSGTAFSLSSLAPSSAAVSAFLAETAANEISVLQGDYGAMVAHRLSAEWFRPIDITLTSIGETGPLMLLGMVLYRTGFFTGGWSVQSLQRLAAAGITLGAGLTVLFLVTLQPQGFPAPVMLDYLLYWSALPHLLMLLGYAALLALIAPRLAATPVGRRLSAAGRTAFSNYLLTSLVMTLLFNGWGLGLAQRFGAAELFGFVLFGWALMLAWSKPWLERFRYGPLEWLWRCLTYWQLFPLRR